MNEVKRIKNIAKIIFNDNLLTLAIENKDTSRYYIMDVVLKEKNMDQYTRFIKDCNDLLNKPLLSKIYTSNEFNLDNINEILISNN